MKNKQYPIVDIGEANVNQEFFKHSDGRHYSVPRLFDYAKDLPVFDCPIAALDLRNTPFDDCNMIQLAWHTKKVVEADLSYPIILWADGAVADGRHRIIKALMEGRSTIKAVRMTWEPEPCKKVKV